MVFSGCGRAPRTQVDWKEWWKENGASCRALEPFFSKGYTQKEFLADAEVKRILNRIDGKNAEYTPGRRFGLLVYGEGIVVSGWGEYVIWRPLDRRDNADYDDRIKFRRGSAALHLEGDWFVNYIAQ